MVKLTKIYTKTGDHGQTQLTGGVSIAKTASCIQLMGSIDELNAHLGVFRTHITNHTILQHLDATCQRQQQALFNLGADISIPNDIKQPGMPHISAGDIEHLEAEMDQWLIDLPSLNSFILPGGHPGAAALHVARTVCRRAERDYWLHHTNTTERNDLNGRYLNRLSDWLFVLARTVNHLTLVKEPLWEPHQ